MTNITVGADPEVFLKASDGTIVSAIGHVGGSKDKPVLVNRGAVQEDNVLAEFNIDPAGSVTEFVGNIKTVLSQLRERVYPLSVDMRASHEFTKQELMRSGRKALMFGCDPDFNAYTGEQNMAPSPFTGLRTAGGHIHVGYENPDNEVSTGIARHMDVYLGLPSLLLDQDQRRRSMYGSAGAMRFKPYGMEYRSLSNFWLQHTDLIEWAYNNTLLAYNSSIIDRCIGCPAESIINTNDVDAAKKWIKHFGVPMP